MFGDLAQKLAVARHQADAAPVKRRRLFQPAEPHQGQQHAGQGAVRHLGTAQPAAKDRRRVLDGPSVLAGPDQVFHLVVALAGRAVAQKVARRAVPQPLVRARGLAAHTFYDNGMQLLWDLNVQGGVWTMSGRWPAPDGVSYEVRCTIRPDAQVRTHLWEYRKDSTSPWRTFLDVKVRPR